VTFRLTNSSGSVKGEDLSASPSTTETTTVAAAMLSLSGWQRQRWLFDEPPLVHAMSRGDQHEILHNVRRGRKRLRRPYSRASSATGNPAAGSALDTAEAARIIVLRRGHCLGVVTWRSPT